MRGKSEFLELVKFTLLTLAIVIPIRMFVAQPFIVNGQSMLPTFHNGDYLIVDELTYHKEDPERGDVVVFHYPSEKNRFLIKRIVGLPGESVNLSGDTVTITKEDGEKIILDEQYTNEDYSSYATWDLGEDEYIVLGDNRNASSDSRSWGILTRDKIVGKTFLRLFPFSDIGFQPGEVEPSIIEITNTESIQ